MKNLIIALLMTKVLADTVMVPCTGPELVGMVIAVFTVVTIMEYELETIRRRIRLRRRKKI